MNHNPPTTGVGITLKQKQTLLTAAMLTSVHILQLTNQQLGSYIHELMVSNPMVDMDQSTPAETPQVKFDFFAPEVTRSAPSGDSSGGTDPGALAAEPTQRRSLAEDLLLQAAALALPRQEQGVLDYLILLLDDNGFLLDEPEQLAQEMHQPPEIVRRCIGLLQTLEPVGVGTRGIRECLLLQLERRGMADSLAAQLVREHLPDLAEGRLAKAARALHTSREQIREAAELIRTLEPKPFNGAANSRYTQFVTPDILVVQQGDEFQCFLNDRYLPRLTLNQDYVNLLKEQGGDNETRKYLSSCLTQVNEVSRFITYRASTLQRVMAYVLTVQRNFFLYGPGHRVAMSNQQIAEALELHESTISRAVSGKYFSCAWGVFPLKSLFAHSLPARTTTGQAEYDQTLALIRELIGQEPPQAAYSDEQLAAELAKRGIAISRRTVAKYRQAMDIPNSTQRNAKRG